MRIFPITVAAAAVAAVVAPAALAKGPFEICGRSGCAVLADEAAGPGVPVGMVRAQTGAAPAAPAPYFVIRFRDLPGALGYWIPSAATIRVRNGAGSALWLAATPEQAAMLRAKTVGLSPLRPPVVTQAGVDLRTVRGPRTYLSLYTLGTPVASAPDAGGWLRVDLWGASTPWTDGSNALAVSRRGAFLRRDGQLVRIPLAVAVRIRARLPLN